jgi:hypothetical protein
MIGVEINQNPFKHKIQKQQQKCRASAQFAVKNTPPSQVLVPRSRSGAAGAACRGM